MCWTVNNAVLTLTIFDSSCQVQICLLKSFIGKMRYYLREKQSSKTVPTLHLNTKKKKVFINLNEHIFPDICAFICCVCFYIILYMNITHSDDISEPFQEHLGKLKCQLCFTITICSFFFCHQFCLLMISHFYLIGQLCSSSWVVWDCLIFVSFKLPLLCLFWIVSG